MQLKLNATVSSIDELKELLSQVAALEIEDIELNVAIRSNEANIKKISEVIDKSVNQSFDRLTSLPGQID